MAGRRQLIRTVGRKPAALQPVHRVVEKLPDSVNGAERSLLRRCRCGIAFERS
jgi:hypothetical protein